MGRAGAAAGALAPAAGRQGAACSTRVVVHIFTLDCNVPGHRAGCCRTSARAPALPLTRRPSIRMALPSPHQGSAQALGPLCEATRTRPALSGGRPPGSSRLRRSGPCCRCTVGIERPWSARQRLQRKCLAWRLPPPPPRRRWRLPQSSCYLPSCHDATPALLWLIQPSLAETPHHLPYARQAGLFSTGRCCGQHVLPPSSQSAMAALMPRLPSWTAPPAMRR